MTDETSDEHPGSHPNPPARHDAPERPTAPEIESVAEIGSRPRPGPGAPVAAAPEPPVSRRWFLAAGGVAVLAGGAGVGAALVHGQTGRPRPNPPPATLLAAVAEERALIADLDATTGGSAAIRQVITQVRADHAAHLQTLESLVSTYDPTPAASGSGSGSATPSSVGRGAARTAVALRTAELAASARASARATSSNGRAAVVLASIAACEAGHAELLR